MELILKKNSRNQVHPEKLGTEIAFEDKTIEDVTVDNLKTLMPV